MFKKIAMAVVAVVLVALVGTLAAASMQPEDFAIRRSTQIKGTAAKVEALITDFHSWDGWSPWNKLDPAMKKTYSGAATGVGAIYEWVGNSDVGKGRMTITAVEPGKSVTIKLEFIEPFAVTNTTVFALAESGDSTSVEWSMSGKNSDLMSKAVGMLMDMDKTVGGDFEKGLSALKGMAEQGK